MNSPLHFQNVNFTIPSTFFSLEYPWLSERYFVALRARLPITQTIQSEK